MSGHIMLVNYTAEGMADIEESPDRLDDGKALVESMGGEVVDFYSSVWKSLLTDGDGPPVRSVLSVPNARLC